MAKAGAKGAAETVGVRGWATGKVQQVRTFFQEVRAELRKVTWPEREELLQSTGLVLLLVFILAMVIALYDKLCNVVFPFFGGGAGGA